MANSIPSASHGQQQSAAYQYGIFGYLQKRQRGRSSLKSTENKRMLKFQERYCILKKDDFAYTTSEKGTVTSRQTFPVKRIAFVKDVANDTFCDIKDHSKCFQFGDKEETLYFQASTVIKKSNWMSKLKQAANDNGNQMLDRYHPGAYGSVHPNEWSCCKRTGHNKKGCTSVETDEIIEEHTSTDNSITSSTKSFDSDSILQGDKLQTRRSSSPISIPLGRRDTNESGIGISKTPLNTPGMFEQDLDGCQEERVNVIQSLNFKSECSLSYNGKCLLIGKRDGLVLLTDVTPEGIKLLSQQRSCFEVAGKVTSMHTCGDYAAIGSAVVQLVNLFDTSVNKRCLLTTTKNLMTTPNHTNLVKFIGNTKQLVSAQLHDDVINIWAPPFHQTLVDKPLLSQKLSDHEHIRILSISTPSKSDIPLISVISTNESHMYLDIFQLSPSETKRRTCVLANVSSGITCTAHAFMSNGRKIAVSQNKTLIFFDIIYSTSDSPDLKLSQPLCYDHESRISCLSCTENDLLGVGLTSGDVVVYKNYYMSQQLKLTRHIGSSKSSISSTNAVVSLAFVDRFDGMWLVAHENGTLNVWKESAEKPQKVHPKNTIGIELHAREILSQPRILLPTANKAAEDIGCGISISLPQEAIDEDIEVEAAFTPYGPGPTTIMRFPANTVVVSPILWVSSNHDKQFKEPAKIILPHCFDCKTQEMAELLTVLKAECSDIHVDDDGQLIIDFNTKIDAEFRPNQPYGIIYDKHFCLYCTQLKTYCSDDALQNINYCLSILKPSTFSTTETHRIFCVLHYDLEGCHKLVDEQTPSEYIRDIITNVQFDTQGDRRILAALTMTVDSASATTAGWTISVLSSNEILAESVNFLNYRKPKILGRACAGGQSPFYPHTYPPRFIIEVSSALAESTQQISLCFTGARRDIRIATVLDKPATSQYGSFYANFERSEPSIQQRVLKFFQSVVEPHARETEV